MNPAIPPSALRIANEIAAVANRLAAPPTPPPRPEHAQSLAHGAAGITLFHIERALAGTGEWDTAHRWLNAAVRAGVLANTDSSLYHGAPAIAFALHLTNQDRSNRYAKAQRTLDQAVAVLAHRRVDLALHRITRRELPTMAEYDIISGLTGIGAHLLRHDRDDGALQRILLYLVRLTEPVRQNGMTLPGWWTAQDPHAATSPAFPGGHANLGLAHGITGPLALLSHAKRRGIVVDGHLDAIEHICDWLDTWRQDHDTGPWWPQWVTHQDRRTGRPTQPGPLRPSWCYGTPGIARAQQLAGLATGDSNRRHLAEQALVSCVADPRQLEQISDVSLCHGWAGLLTTTWRTATDAATPAITEHLPHLIGQLLQHNETKELGDGLLEGRAGTALALAAIAHGEPSVSGWDTCLLIT
ncbi:lanthionine synthetase C family protein [Micromonospora craniellae]|uniref:Lanthionine synthetase n=1 Tax=Micromonospora craniellae TaxID=2294034 RepID=A0A372FR47_9ACTN|nr:lanthionine synthetase C family protein [Micromonospora craniellae]QOC94413.1 lanthionine synthetase C family protein [Micromonospora craniellae]RFS43203.1 lanthionine synthetase [Micromonospora craniellae]